MLQLLQSHFQNKYITECDVTEMLLNAIDLTSTDAYC